MCVPPAIAAQKDTEEQGWTMCVLGFKGCKGFRGNTRGRLQGAAGNGEGGRVGGLPRPAQLHRLPQHQRALAGAAHRPHDLRVIGNRPEAV